MKWPKLEPNPYLDLRGPGDVRVNGTRVQLELVIDAYQEGQEPERIVYGYPSLSLEAVHGVIAYYLGHKEAVDRHRALCSERNSELEAEYDAKPVPTAVERVLAARAAKKSA